MYESHFGFNGSPFQLNPDPAFYFSSRGHSNALAYLKFGAHQGEGFIVVTGEIGAGKTTLVRTLLEGLNPDEVVAAHVVNTQLESTELLQSILLAFGVAASRTSKAYLIATLEGFLTTLAAKGRRALLIIDEAQNLRHEAVEELRMLSNFQLGKHGLLQSFLVGQPELRELLQSKSMEQLRQRVIASCHLGPLDVVETRAYVEHRLRLVGWKGTFPDIAADVFQRIHHWTGGVPRRINRMCNRLLLAAFLANARVITAAMADETALELKGEIGEGTPAPPPDAPTAAAATPRVPAPQAASSPATPSPPAARQVATGASAPPGVALQPNASPESVTPPPQTAAAPTSPAPPVVAIRFAAEATPPQAEGRKGTSKSATPRPAPIAPVATGALPGPTAPAAVVRLVEGAPSTPLVVRRVHQALEASRPLLCLVDSALDYLKAGVLSDAFRGYPSLPRVVAVHSGPDAELGLDDLEETRMPMPALGLHLGIPLGTFATQTSQLAHAFDALLTEMNPCAVLVPGSSDASLTCSLLTKKRGIALLRTGSGKRDTRRASSSAANAVLIERLADVLYTDSTESFYALYREGIRLDRVQSVGSLTREVHDIALVKRLSLPAQPAASNAGLPRLPGAYGLINIDPRIGFPEVGSRACALELFSELSQELPLVWMLRAAERAALEKSSIWRKIDLSKLTLVEVSGVGQTLALLHDAKCMITRDNDAWLPEAQALALPTLVLTPNSVLESALCADGAAPLEMRAGSAQGDFRRMLDSSGPPAQPPEYWDGGTAARIASHLVGWLSSPGAGSKPLALAVAALAGAETVHK